MRPCLSASLAQGADFSYARKEAKKPGGVCIGCFIVLELCSCFPENAFTDDKGFLVECWHGPCAGPTFGRVGRNAK